MYTKPPLKGATEVKKRKEKPKASRAVTLEPNSSRRKSKQSSRMAAGYHGGVGVGVVGVCRRVVKGRVGRECDRRQWFCWAQEGIEEKGRKHVEDGGVSQTCVRSDEIKLRRKCPATAQGGPDYGRWYRRCWLGRSRRRGRKKMSRTLQGRSDYSFTSTCVQEREGRGAWRSRCRGS